MKKIMQNAILLLLYMTLLLGIIYPFIIWGAGQIFFRHQANGSLAVKDGKVIGSSLIAQPFTGVKYFHPRPSAVAYNAQGSGGSNLGPSNPALISAVKTFIDWAKKENSAPVPMDMVTQSGSGLDPHISQASAFWQAKRVAKARAVDEKAVVDIINRMTEKPFLGIFGEKRVNVLALNMMLDDNFIGGKK
jgi:potassium-transporting ATPase KdpC subunit